MSLARKRRKLTQQQLAEKVGTSRVTIARLETGSRQPSMAVALRIAGELGKSVDKLFGGER
jgi:putative transcriptional regulator